MNELDKAVETLKPGKSNGKLTIIGEVASDESSGKLYEEPEQVEDVYECETKDTRNTIMLVGIIGTILVFYMISHHYYTDGVIWHAVIAWVVAFVSALPIILAIMKYLKKLLKIR